MSAYQAKISLIVEGEQKIKSLQDRVNNLSKQITELTRLDVRKVFDDTLISGAISHLKKAREEEAKATNGVIKGQRLLNNSTEQRLVQQIKLNAAVDLYARRVNELGRTSAGDQKQFQARIEDIQKGFEFFKGKGSVQGVQAVATELGRIVEYSREVNRLETGRIRSQEQLRGYSAEIAKYKALGLNTNKAETTFDKLAVNAGTNKYALAEKYNIVLGKRLRILKDEATAQKQEANRVEKLQFRPSSPIQGAVDIIGSPINKQIQAAVALAQQKQKAADLELKELQNGTKSAVALAQQKQKAADLELKELQNGTKSAVALAQQKQKAADLELKELQNGTKSAVALAQQKQKAADLELKELQNGTKSAVALAQQKQKAADLELKELQNGTKSAVALAQQKQKAADLELKELQNGTKSAVALAQQKQKAADLELKELQNGTKAAVALAQQKQKAADLELKELQNGTKAAVALAQQKQKAADQQKKAGAQRAESIALGVGFPLMFGAGPASVAGSLAGSFAGSGFGGQILGGALGAAIDKLGVAAIDTGKSLTYPIEGFEKLKEASLFASREQEYYISKLIETGRVAEATAVIQAEMIKKVGVRGVNDLAALGESSIELSKVWAEFNLQLQVALAGPMTGLLKWLTGIVGLVSTINAEKTTAEEVRAGLSSKDRAKFDKEIAKIRNAYGDVPGKAITFEEARKRKAQVVQEFESRSKPQTARGALTPEDREKAIKAAEQQADTIKDAYRTGFRLQQQGLDLQRQGSDLQRRVAQDIYNKQQEILRLQVDNDRQRKQVAIEMVDLEYRRRISNEEGRVAAVLEAEAALMKTKAEGEAKIEAKKRLLELDIDKQKRETENYIFELGRTIDGIRRSTLSLEMDVADYRLKIERQIGEQRRIEEAGQAAGVVQTTGGRSGVTANSVAGFPITSRQGMRTHHPVTGGQKMHAGTDIGTPMNTALAYSMGGVVTKATTMGGYGKILEVKLDNGVTAFAAHLNETLVKAGDKFTARQLLARTGQTGVGTGPHLHMEGNRGGDSTAPLPYLVLNGKASKVAAAAQSLPSWLGPIAKGANKPAGSMETQLQNAAGQAITRPVVTPNVAGVQAGMGEYNEKNAALRKQALSIEQQLQKLQEQGALDRLAEVARGPKEIQQRKDALAYAKADLATIGAASQDKQELLAFEAQSAVKLKLKEDENLKISNQIKANDALTTKQKTDVLGKVQEALDIAKQQIALDKEALVIAQQTRFEKEKAAIQAQLGITGKGLQAGFIGQAGQAYESEMLKSGNVVQAQALAEQTQALELATTKARALEGAYNDIGSAMASTLTDGVAGLVAGTTTAEQVFVDFLKNIGDALMKAAQQMIAQYLAIAAAKALAGLFGGGGGGGSLYGGGGGEALGQAGSFGGNAFSNVGGIEFGSFGVGSFAEGGRPPVGKASLVGEKGPELFVPSSSGTIIPADATAAAMARYQRQGSGSGAGGSGSDAMGAGEATPVLSMSFETTRFMDRDWVDKDQLVAAMAATERRATTAGAKAGAAQVSSQMRNSPGYRRQVGLR
jgi:murein DD-endopeptidase MepM/ murein hydrolase activator NlpD